MSSRTQEDKPEPVHQVEDINMIDDVNAICASHAGLDEANQPRYDDKETARILRKVDYRLLPVLTVLYALAFLDRSNIGNARVAGMEADLNLTPSQYNIVLMMFFITYSLFEPPSNSMLKIVKPSTWLSIIVTCWGIVVVMQGICRTYHQMIAMRLLLGMFEAGFGPGAAYILTLWYARFDLQKRLAVFTCGGCFSGAFSGLVAYGIVHMDGLAGIRGWRWIFILEGILTVIVGASLHWILPDSPETASFFTEGEKTFMAARLDSDSGTSAGKVGRHDKLSWKQVRAAFMDWKIYVAGMIQFTLAATLYSFTFTLPTIIHRLGYSAANAQLLTVPVYTCAIIANLSSGWLADRVRVRWLFIVFPGCLVILSLVGLLSIPHPRLPGLAYFLLFPLPIGLYPALLAILTWVSNNIAPSSKRVVGTALYLCIGNLGGLAGSNIFLTRQAPHYWTGYGSCIGFIFVAMACAVTLRIAYGRLNKQRDAMSEDEIRARYSEEELEAMGDSGPFYRYVI